MSNSIKKFNDYIKEANETSDQNNQVLQNNAVVYNKYKTRVTSMFNNAKPDDMEKINQNFENFIKSLPEDEKGSSDLLRTLYSSEKIKFDIKSLEIQKKDIEAQLQQRMKDLKQISDNLK